MRLLPALIYGTSIAMGHSKRYVVRTTYYTLLCYPKGPLRSAISRQADVSNTLAQYTVVAIAPHFLPRKTKHGTNFAAEILERILNATVLKIYNFKSSGFLCR